MHAAKGQHKKGGNSTPPLDGKRQGITITRTYPGVDGPETETLDGIYLLKPGLEEQTVAEWLNHISTYIRAHLSQFSDAGPSSRTRGNIQHMTRRWSSESSTKAHHIGDTNLELRPDLVLLQPDEYNKVPSSFSWRNIASFLELTSQDFSSHLRLQLMKKAYGVFIAEPGRHFLIVLSIANIHFRMHVFDHSGVVHSCGYNLHRHAGFFVQVLYTLTTAPPEHLGFDPTLSFSTTISRMNCLCTELYIMLNGKKYIILSLLFYNEMIHGRTTLCFIIYDPVNRKRYVVKDSWTRLGRVTTEEDMLTRIKEKGLTYGVPVLEAVWTVQISGKDDSTDLHRPNYLFAEGSTPPRLEYIVTYFSRLSANL
ncbi:hypothetical protein OG21DRAFT_1489778 [Imleria badia]|nr:hypothetical protein OG21DRAFT_1489778 [Imleria badia]